MQFTYNSISLLPQERGMAKVCVSLAIFLIFLSICANANERFHGKVRKSDIQALKAFKESIRVDSWSNQEHICSWRGVECSWSHANKEFRIVGLKLRNLNLQGTIPPQIGLLSDLRSFDVSGNSLTGEIPVEITTLKHLRLVNLSYNWLVGPIPHGGPKSLQRTNAFVGNPGLCGFPLDRKCPTYSSPSWLLRRFTYVSSWVSKLLIPSKSTKSVLLRRSLLDAPAPAPAPISSQRNRSDQSPSPSPNPSPVRHRRSKLRRWGIGAALGIAAGSVAGIIVGTLARIGIFIYKNSRAKKGPIIFHHKINPKMLAFLDKPDTLQGLEEVGSGGAGKVYKATLETGLTVAIKRIPIQPPPDPSSGNESGGSKSSSMGKKHTVAELETLGKIRHLNLAWLYAYIRQPDAHLLVYQFMPSGSLYDVLAKVREGGMQLDWKTRRKIAIGMTNGLKYLHHDCDPRILHRDLKTSNILLDEELEAHLGDFGLAKALPDDMTHVSTGPAGTVGYIAPEYHQTCKFTTSSDVYSLGIVLGVLLCGKEPTDDYFQEFAEGIVTWMCYLVQTGQELKGIDPSLVRAPDDGPDNTHAENGTVQVDDIAEMKLMMRIACLCTKPNPAERPSTKDVLFMLNPGKLGMKRPMDELIVANE